MARAISGGDDLAGNFEPKGVGRAWWRGIKAAPLKQVWSVHPCRGNAHENLSRPDSGHWPFDEREFLRTVGLRCDYGLHRGGEACHAAGLLTCAGDRVNGPDRGPGRPLSKQAWRPAG